ncbi:MAG: hypothetical protein L0H53_16820 [Candidatus Nitrosocosmicus sp.]|nr:hypothetical protein [Candidatus Nitrosocosmicus sp.]MDN5868172.1 hypothetical protein [Candidatus Nitrosocosmicus sp.]
MAIEPSWLDEIFGTVPNDGQVDTLTETSKSNPPNEIPKLDGLLKLPGLKEIDNNQIK